VVHRTSAGAAHTFGIQSPTADSASGGFSRQVPPLPVTPAVGLNLGFFSLFYAFQNRFARCSRFASWLGWSVFVVFLNSVLCQPCKNQPHLAFSLAESWLR